MKKQLFVWVIILGLILAGVFYIGNKRFSKDIPYNIELSGSDYNMTKGQQRFAIEGARIEIYNEIHALGTGMREAQGVHFTKWGRIEPHAPVNGVATYLTPQKGDWSLIYFKQIKNSGVDLSVAIEYDNSDWAIERDENIQVINPGTGKRMPGLVRIKPEHEQDYKNFIKHYISVMPNLKYIQVDNEPENVWTNGEGYYRVLELTKEAVTEYEQETGDKITIMAAGFNLGSNFIILPDDVKNHMYENHPNINHEFLKKRINEELIEIGEEPLSEELLSPQRIQHFSQKIHVTMTVLNQENPAFDIFTIHLDHGKTYDYANEVINWYKTQMENNGYDRPLWIDDMSNNYFPTKETQEDITLMQGLENKDPEIIKEHTKRQPAWLIRKTVGHFSAGAEKVKIAYDMEIDYYMAEWRQAGLFNLITQKPKPAYYTAKIMIEKLDYFKTATKINLNQEDYLYKFTFEDKDDIYVAWTEPQKQNESYWSDQTIKTIDLSEYINTDNVEITYLVNEINLRNQPITKPNQKVPTTQVPLSSEPVFIEAEGKQRFAIDGESGTIETLNDVVLLNDGLSELQGTGIVMWGAIQPNAPINGVATYTNINDPKAKQYKEFFKEYQKTDRELSAVIEFYYNDWALELHPTIKVISPRTKERIPGFVRIKPEYEQAWKDFIKYYISIIPNLKYIQIDNEPEHTWVSGEGYYKALELAYEAVQEYNTEHNTNIKIMAAGFSAGGNMLDLFPENIKTHMYENYPDINETWIIQELESSEITLPPELDENKLSYLIQRYSQKIHVTLTVLKRENPSFDILTIHADYSKSSRINQQFESTLILKQIMQENGYDRPIWLDDMHSGYVRGQTNLTDFDNYLIQGLESRNPTVISMNAKRQPTWLVRKTANNFAVGFERVKIAHLHDTPEYNFADWRYVGLFTHENKRKPSYYTAKIMIEKLDYFKTATKINLNQEDYLYKFTFKNKPDIYVAWTEPQKQNESYWSDQTIKTIDLSEYINTDNVEITYLVNEINLRNQPITKPNKTVPTTQVPLSSEPIFITTK
jgi:hypothetical protein